MPRNHNAGPSTLRNRNRVTNKTRLKVIRDSIDADPIVLDEDEEKARVVSTAGVDAEDANEHHLQAVLSAAASRHQASARSTRAASEKEAPAPKAYIPTPDSTGKVENYEELYPSNRWKDPATNVKSSDTVEEAISHALVNGFIYYMDERDKEWLDKNNEEARGEGTSAQGAVSGTNTRSGRSTKAKGKDPDVSSPVIIAEDEFELVMAIFEKVTHEKTEFLHHGLDQGAPFPPFSDYQDTFANELSPSMFALFAIPPWVPKPEILSRYARAVYPYWKERRIERGGHRIIPTVNLDETDTKNESYICFRRREIKAIRKTRAQQTTYSDKMLRLQAELTMSIDLAKCVLQREQLKREAAVQGQAVWERRLALVELKRKFPSLGTKEDEELLFDKERVAKKPKVEASRISIKSRTRDTADLASPNAHVEPQIRPKEREAIIRSQIEQDVARRKEDNRSWDDLVDNPYQQPPLPYPSRLFKVIHHSTNVSPDTPPTGGLSEKPVSFNARAGRLRFGRGGRMHFDRRALRPRNASPIRPWSDDEDSEDPEALESARHLAERWRYDDDDGPLGGTDGPEGNDRVLVEDYQPKWLVHQMTLLSDADHNSLTPDPTVLVSGSDGRQAPVVAYRLGAQPNLRQVVGIHRGSPTLITNWPSGQPANGSPLQPVATAAAIPVAVSTPVKMASSSSVSHMRISSNGGMRASGPPALPAIPPVPTPSESPQTTPPNSASLTNALHDGTESSVKQTVQPQPIPNGTVQHNQHDPEQAQADAAAAAAVPLLSSPMRPKSQNQQQQPNASFPNVPNGHHIAMNGYPTVPNGAAAAAAAAAYMQHAQARGNSQMSMQALKSAFASMNQTPDAAMQGGNSTVPMRAPNGAYMAHVLPNGANYNMQQLAARHMNWPAATVAAAQRPPSANGGDMNGTDGVGMGHISPQIAPAVPGTPTRAPSAAGMRAGPLPRGYAVGGVNHALSGAAQVQVQGRASPGNIARLTPQVSPTPHMLSPSSLAAAAAAAVQASPTRQSQVPLTQPSPSMQTRQAVGSSGAGY